RGFVGGTRSRPNVMQEVNESPVFVAHPFPEVVAGVLALRVRFRAEGFRDFVLEDRTLSDMGGGASNVKVGATEGFAAFDFRPQRRDRDPLLVVDVVRN